jgi:hypothetical protein
LINQIRGTVTYEGGEVVAWQARPRDVSRMETYARRQGIEVREGALSPTLAMYLAYSALRIEEGFEVWLDSLDDFEDLTGDELVPPTRPGASLER